MARKARHWTQAELAEKAGCGAKTIWNLERGLPCHPSTLADVAKALGVPYANLTTEALPPPSGDPQNRDPQQSQQTSSRGSYFDAGLIVGQLRWASALSETKLVQDLAANVAMHEVVRVGNPGAQSLRTWLTHVRRNPLDWQTPENLLVEAEGQMLERGDAFRLGRSFSQVRGGILCADPETASPAQVDFAVNAVRRATAFMLGALTPFLARKDIYVPLSQHAMIMHLLTGQLLSVMIPSLCARFESWADRLRNGLIDSPENNHDPMPLARKAAAVGLISYRFVTMAEILSDTRLGTPEQAEFQRTGEMLLVALSLIPFGEAAAARLRHLFSNTHHVANGDLSSAIEEELSRVRPGLCRFFRGGSFVTRGVTTLEITKGVRRTFRSRDRQRYSLTWKSSALLGAYEVLAAMEELQEPLAQREDIGYSILRLAFDVTDAQHSLDSVANNVPSADKAFDKAFKTANILREHLLHTLVE